jgi:menaquinone-dependent protoporphyrinogen oxidase
MPEVLIVYASTHGHTAKIATRIARGLEDRGAAAQVCDIASAAELAPPDFDAVIVGASVHNGHHQRDIVAWAEGHATALSMMPSAFFSVCLTAADDTDDARQATRNYLDDFEDQTGWTPRMTVSFAGALQYREYDFPTRLVMRLLMSRGHHPTDVTQDYDYTDWEAVDRFADDLSHMVADAVPATS